jgi:membrane protease YdiL (CAAX protease family)
VNDTSKPVERFGLNSIVFGLLILSFLVYNLAGYNYFLGADLTRWVKLLTPIVVYFIYSWAKRVDACGILVRVLYGFFSVSVGFLFVWLFGGFTEYLPWVDLDSVMGWAILKVGEVVPICLAVLILGMRNGDSFRSLGLIGRDIGKSLVFGLAASVLGFVQYFAMVGVSFPYTIPQFMFWLPWLVLFSVSNGFMEELIFRGLFLGKYTDLFGKQGALLLISCVFALFHVILLPFMGLGMVLVFAVFLFFQGYVWGVIYQKTGSIWGSILAHAVADVLFVLAAFSSG